MKVDKIRFQGAYETHDNTPIRAIIAPLLPAEGGFSLTGTLLAVEDTAMRPTVAFYPRFTGSVVGGQAMIDPSSSQASPASSEAAAQSPGAVAAKVVATGRQLEVQLTGATGRTLQWGWDLELVTITLHGLPDLAVGPAPGAPGLGLATTIPAGTTTATVGGGGGAGPKATTTGAGPKAPPTGSSASSDAEGSSTY